MIPSKHLLVGYQYGHAIIALAPNLKQRVVGNPNPIKLGRCFDFLRNYYGIQHGGDRKSEMVKSKPNNSDLISNEDLANTYSVSVDTMENYIKLSLDNLTKNSAVTNDLRQKSD